ncbi:hypothetical protein T09_12773 [Trichinella sp. T9]|nr:hypothetical protein T09_12773 [Trichinella sp. T9]
MDKANEYKLENLGLNLKMEFAPRSLSKLESSWQPIQQCAEAELAYSSYTAERRESLLEYFVVKLSLSLLLDSLLCLPRLGSPVIEPLLLNGLHQLPAVSIYAHFFLRANLLNQQFLKIENVGQNWSQKSLHMTNGYPSTVNNKNGRSRFEISKSEKQSVETSEMFNQLNNIMQIFKIASQGTKMANWSMPKQVAIPKCDDKHQFARLGHGTVQRDGSPIIQTFQIAQLEAKKLFISKQVKSSVDDAGHNLSQQYQITDKSVPAGGSASVGDQFLPFPPPTSRYYRNMERKHFSRLAACGQMDCFICQS